MDKDKEWIKKDIVDIYNGIDRLSDLFYIGSADSECTKEVLVNRIKLYREETLKLQAFVGKILYG